MFSNDKTGDLIQTPYNVRAFVPRPLPPVLDMDQLIVPLMKATHAVGELSGASRRLANPYILVRPLQRREALTSSAMEGTFTTEDELLLADAGLQETTDQSSLEVRNYLRALSSTLTMLTVDKIPICHRMIKTAHSILLSDVGSNRGANRSPGEYKSDQNAIGGARKGIKNARFVPPPPAEALICMDQLEAYINRSDRDATPPLIDMALVHYQIETIHPFSDGNGRVGRMLISLMAIDRGLFDTPLLYVSPELENKKDEYTDLMLGVSTHGDWISWIAFFLEIVEQSARNSIRVVDRLLELQDRLRDRVSLSSRTSNAVLLVDMLFDTPIVTVRDVQDAFSVTYRAARKTIEKLEELEILVELPEHYPTVFFAPEIMRVADRNP
jgi:cell filamentation protein, protein adenylyltransferase